jgi:hypothetical protein
MNRLEIFNILQKVPPVNFDNISVIHQDELSNYPYVTKYRIKITPSWLAKWDIPIGDFGRVLDFSARDLRFESRHGQLNFSVILKKMYSF